MARLLECTTWVAQATSRSIARHMAGLPRRIHFLRCRANLADPISPCVSTSTTTRTRPTCNKDLPAVHRRQIRLASHNQSYNVVVPIFSDKRKSDQLANLRRSTMQQYKMEATGILIIGLLILAITLIRYWHNISWSPR